MSKYPLKKFTNLLEKCTSILQIAHVHPDGDTLGSNLALQEILKENGFQSDIACIHKPAIQYSFLPGIEGVTQDFDEDKYDLIITVDVADLSKMSGFYNDHKQFFDETTLINIDHHPTNPNFGEVNIVDSKASSVGEIMYSILTDLGATLTHNIATNLLTALFFDTGSFYHSNTSSDVMKIASELMKYGPQNDKIAYELFQKKSYEALKLWGRALSNIRVDHKNSIAWVFISRQDMEATGATYKDVEGLTGLFQGIPNIRLTVVLSERENGQVKGSIRSVDGVNASYFASVFGGGGHKKAAGFSTPLLQKDLYDRIDPFIQDFPI